MKALYVGSFDPFTFGHLNIALRAAAMFGNQLTIGIGNNPSKKYMFSVDERINLIKGIPQIRESKIEVVVINNLTADYANINGYTHLIKGARTAQDFDYEKLINEITLTQQRDLETVLLFSDTKLSHVSSSAAKELAKFQGLIHEFVPVNIKDAIETKLGQCVIGVTGTVGSGKSTFCKALSTEYGIPCTHIDMDKLAHRLLEEDTPIAKRLRGMLVQTFGTYERKALGQIVFGDKNKLEQLNQLYRQPILSLLREELREKKGIILLEGALLAELDWLFLCNNNVILIQEPPTAKHVNPLLKRGHTPEQAASRIVSQYSFDKKSEIISEAIKKSGHGYLAIQKSEYAISHDAYLLLHKKNGELKRSA